MTANHPPRQLSYYHTVKEKATARDHFQPFLKLYCSLVDCKIFSFVQTAGGIIFLGCLKQNPRNNLMVNSSNLARTLT